MMLAKGRAERLLDPLAAALAEVVTGVTGGAAVDRSLAEHLPVLLKWPSITMCGVTQPAPSVRERRCDIVGLVRTERDPSSPPTAAFCWTQCTQSPEIRQ